MSCVCVCYLISFKFRFLGFLFEIERSLKLSFGLLFFLNTTGLFYVIHWSEREREEREKEEELCVCRERRRGVDVCDGVCVGGYRNDVVCTYMYVCMGDHNT